MTAARHADTAALGARPPAPTAVGEVRGLTLLKHLPGLILDPLAAIGASIGQGVGVIEYRGAGRCAVVVNDAELVHEVLTSSRRFVKPRLGDRFRLWFGSEGLPTPGEFRELAKAGFANRKVDELVPEIDRAVSTLQPRLDYHALTGRPIDVAAVATRAALLASGSSLFGADLRSDAGRMVEALDEIQRYYARQGVRIALGLPDIVRTPSSQRVRIAAADLRAVTSRLIDGRDRAGPGADLLALLLDNCRRVGSIDRRMLENIVMSALLSSFETTGCALAWTLTMVASQPEHAAAIAGEAGGGSAPTVEAIGQATHTRAVMSETLRLYPPSWIIMREALAETTLGGHRIRRGASVLVSPYWVHRDDARWPDPLVFEPNRFGPSAPSPEPGSYIPFGAGAHACFGERFAMRTGHVLLRRLVGRYEMSPVEAPLPRPEALISLRPSGPVHVRLALRRA